MGKIEGEVLGFLQEVLEVQSVEIEKQDDGDDEDDHREKLKMKPNEQYLLNQNEFLLHLGQIYLSR